MIRNNLTKPSSINSTTERKLSLPNFDEANGAEDNSHKPSKTSSCDSFLNTTDNTIPASPNDNTAIENVGKNSSRTNSEMPINVINCENIEIHFDREDESNKRFNASNRSTPRTTYKTNDWYSESPHSTKYNSPERHSDALNYKNIVSYVQKMDISNNSSELDREDAHFELSEALISAFEIFKWDKNEKNRKLDSKHLTPNQKNSSAVSSPSSSYTFSNTEENISGSNCVVDEELEYVEWEDNVQKNSAEAITISLLAKLNSKPSQPNLNCLVSENDAPQKLLPLPNGRIINPDDENFLSATIRGTREWAPPRAQIIFTRHKVKDRKNVLVKQNYRCAGCGMRVAAIYSRHFRYCDYIGKFHCSGCHKNQIAIIPARVLERWDFSYHLVSVFSYKLLEQLWLSPLFNIKELNSDLYVKVKSLSQTKKKRENLKYIKDFIMACRFADNQKAILQTLPHHWVNDLEVWAMADFEAVKNGIMQKNIEDTIKSCENHIKDCELCIARGFICELCPEKDTIIFPWQKNIIRCNSCGSCYHKNCWKSKCSKCERVKSRQHKEMIRKNTN